MEGREDEYEGWFERGVNPGDIAAGGMLDAPGKVGEGVTRSRCVEPKAAPVAPEEDATIKAPVGFMLKCEVLDGVLVDCENDGDCE